MLRDSPASPAQRLLTTFIADYEDTVHGPVPSGLVVEVLGELGISSDAVRTALSRLVKGGLLERTKIGRSTSYGLSDTGRGLVTESTERIMSFGQPRPWDGGWTLLAFSVKEEEVQNVRHQLRTRLRAIGFAPIYDGLWCAAHATVEEARGAADEAGVLDAMVFRGRLDIGPRGADRFRDAWDLDGLRRDYADFIDAFEPLLARVRAGSVTPAESLLARIRVMDAWRSFPRRDPDLPDDFLGPDWPRARAREVFLGCYTALARTAELRLGMLLEDYVVV